MRKLIVIMAMCAITLVGCGETEGKVEKDYRKNKDEIVEYDEKHQEDLAIVFAQQELKNQGYDKYNSDMSQYNVSSIYVNGGTDEEGYLRWNVTTSNSPYGRIKVMFDWDGTERGGYSYVNLQYLLVGGEEIYDRR